MRCPLPCVVIIVVGVYGGQGTVKNVAMFQKTAFCYFVLCVVVLCVLSFFVFVFVFVFVGVVACVPVVCWL